MSHILKRDQRRGGRGRFHGRQRWRMRPTCLELEGRALLSTIVVNNPTDTPVAGETDLRQAIALANTNGGAESITFDKKVFNTPQTINLDPALGQLELSDQTGTETITGPRAGVTIKGNYTTPGVANSIFEIEPGATATLSGLTITGGNNPIFGGGVDDYGTATLIDCTITGNPGEAVLPTIFAVRHSSTARSATTSESYYGFGGGGGVWSYGTTTLTNCTISGNSAAVGGGGLANYGGPLTLTNCNVSGNSALYGGGVGNLARPSTQPSTPRPRSPTARQRQLGPMGRRAGKHRRRDDARQLRRRQQPGPGHLRHRHGLGRRHLDVKVGVSRSPAAHSPGTRQPASLELITLAVSLPVMALAAGSLSGTTRPPPLPIPRSWVTSPKALPAPRD